MEPPLDKSLDLPKRTSPLVFGLKHLEIQLKTVGIDQKRKEYSLHQSYSTDDWLRGQTL